MKATKKKESLLIQMQDEQVDMRRRKRTERTAKFGGPDGLATSLVRSFKRT